MFNNYSLSAVKKFRLVGLFGSRITDSPARIAERGRKPRLQKLSFAQLRINRAEYALQAATDGRQNTDDRDGDQGGDEAVFDRGDAAFVIPEFGQHVISFQGRVVIVRPSTPSD